MAKVLFYHWDHNQGLDVEAVGRMYRAVFDGANLPEMSGDIPTADWGEPTIAIMSVALPKDVVGELFLQYLHTEGAMYWWNKEEAPVPFEVAL